MFFQSLAMAIMIGKTFDITKNEQKEPAARALSGMP